jgi:pyruvate dehydrogenase E2 component (dihydrolipoamide acetyltransferase)
MATLKQFELPDLGEGLTEGEILKWLVAVGDTVELNQPIVEVETAKAAVEIPAKWAGRVEAIFHGEGETVEVGTPIIAIETAPSDAAPAEAAAANAAGSTGAAANGAAANGAAAVEKTSVLVGYGPRAGSVKRRPRKSTPAVVPPAAVAPPAEVLPPPELETAPVSPAVPAEAADLAQPTNLAQPTDLAKSPVLAKPPVRKLARDLGVDLSALTGTGPQGSITRDDVQTAAAAPTAGAATPAQAARPAAAPAFGADREQRVPIRGVRKLTAENMVASAFTAPHVTEFLTVDVTRSMRALDRLRAQPEWQDARLSPLLLVAKAALLAIGRHPLVNSTWSGETGEIVVKEYVNLGIAAATERGLIVPNIKDAGRLSLRELADALTGLVQTAKAGRTPPADMSGGTFTITNVGVFGVDSGTPILPPGEAAILAFGAVREAPWAHRGKVKVRQVTTLSLSFDHRIVDGELGSNFLRDIGRFVTDPEAMLLAWC